MIWKAPIIRINTACCRRSAPPSASDPSILSNITMDTFPSYNNDNDTLVGVNKPCFEVKI